MLTFEEFCKNIHQDSSYEFGDLLEQIVYGTAANFRKHELEGLLKEIRQFLSGGKYIDARIIAERNSDILLIRKKNEKTDLETILGAVELCCDDDFRNWKDINKRIDGFSID